MVQPLYSMKIVCESLELGSLPLPPGPQTMCDAPSRPAYWPLSPALGNCPSLLQTKLDFIKRNILSQKASLVAQMVKNLPAMLETQVQSLGQEDPIE